MVLFVAMFGCVRADTNRARMAFRLVSREPLEETSAEPLGGESPVGGAGEPLWTGGKTAGTDWREWWTEVGGRAEKGLGAGGAGGGSLMGGGGMERM